MQKIDLPIFEIVKSLYDQGYLQSLSLSPIYMIDVIYTNATVEYYSNVMQELNDYKHSVFDDFFWSSSRAIISDVSNNEERRKIWKSLPDLIQNPDPCFFRSLNFSHQKVNLLDHCILIFLDEILLQLLLAYSNINNDCRIHYKFL
jgi:hypothetical protein